MRIAVLILVLAGFWMALSGFLKPLLLVFGVLSIALCAWIAHRMRTVDEEGVPLQVAWAALTYMPWLMVEIVKSSWTVAQIIIDPKLPISPVLTCVRGSQKTPVGLAVYANSITLTPGTVTAIVDGSVLTVHALRSDGADDIEAGGMDARVSQFEGSR